MLLEGQPAPEFSLLDQDGQRVTLSQFLGRQVVVYFYPKDDTPGCTREGIEFTENRDAFDTKNTVVIGISKDSTDSHKSFCTKYNLGITLLSDPDNAVIDAYGAWQEKSNYGKKYMGIVRSTVLIDSNGIVKKYWKNVKVDGHVSAVLNAAG
ncbi:thioredoxin-dependent thiol peroxidase [bacterium]|nr:thioredoxin-dependent thiol peroxidase [bacterium]